MDFFKAFPEETRLPGLQRLYGGRWAMTRLRALGDGTEMKADYLPANATQFSYEADGTELAQITAAGIAVADFHLTGITLGGQGEEVSALYKYETLTNVLVPMGEATLGRDENDILTGRVPYIGLPGATGGLNIGDTFTVGGVSCVVTEKEIVSNDAFDQVTYIAREVGSGTGGVTEIQIGGDEISVDTNNRHTLTRKLTQSAAAPYVPLAIGSSITVGGIVYGLDEETKTETGATRTITRRYVEASGTLTQVGRDQISVDANGRHTLLRDYIQLVSAGYVQGTIGSTTMSGAITYVLSEETKVEGENVRRVKRAYVEATAAWVQIGPSKIDRDTNGLLRVRRLLIAIAGTAAPALTTLSATAPVSGATAKTTYLAQVSDAESDTAIGRITATYLEAGVLSKSQSPGPAGLPGTVRHEWSTWKVDPTDAAAMTAAGAGSIIPGVVVDISNSDITGFPTKRYSTLAMADDSTPIGKTLSTFNTLVQINNPGTLTVATFVVTGGTIPYLSSTSPTRGQVAAVCTVTLEATAPAVAKPTAYNLDSLSVNIVQVGRSREYKGTMSTNSGSVTVSLTQEKVDVNQDSRSGYIYVASAANGVEQSYAYDAGLQLSGDGTIISTIQNINYGTISLSGSTTYPAPASGNLISIDIDPITLTYNGTILYRVTRYKVP